MPCQRAKITRHVAAPVGTFTAPSRKFEHIHLDIIVMPSEEKRYCLTCVDSFTRWSKTLPIGDQEAEAVARAFYEGLICRFGISLRVTTDQGRQFESHLFRQLNDRDHSLKNGSISPGSKRHGGMIPSAAKGSNYMSCE